MKYNRFPGPLVATMLVFAVAMVCCDAFLDGTQCKVKMVTDKATADKGEKAYDDTLSFADGKFSSSTFQARGFKPASYKGEKEDIEAEFEVEQTSVTNGVVTWLGEIRGKKFAGRLTWKKKDGTSLSYDFEGTMK
jgi:hypothetical protein